MNDEQHNELNIQMGYGLELIEIISSAKREYRKLNATGTRLEIRFKRPETLSNDPNEWCRLAFTESLKFIERELNKATQDRVGFTFSNSENHKIDFCISFRRFDQYNADLILSMLDIVIQSNTNFLVDDSLILKVDHVKIPTGSGRRTHIGKSTIDYFKIRKNSIYNPIIRNEDGNICLAVAILLGKIYADGETSEYLFTFLKYCGNHNELISRATQLTEAANVNLEHGGGIDEIALFQDFFRSVYNINVYSSRDGREVYFKSPHQNHKHINLLLDNGQLCD